MSISTLLSNDVILDKLVDIIDAKSGNVSSVSGTLPIVVAPTAGDCVVSLDISGTPQTNDLVGWNGVGEGLAWISQGYTLRQTINSPVFASVGNSYVPSTTLVNKVSVWENSNSCVLILPFNANYANNFTLGTLPPNAVSAITAICDTIIDIPQECISAIEYPQSPLCVLRSNGNVGLGAFVIDATGKMNIYADFKGVFLATGDVLTIGLPSVLYFPKIAL